VGDGRVVVAYVHSNDVAINFHHSMFKMWEHLLRQDVPLLAGWLPMRYGTGGLVEARNRAAATFLETPHEWMLWLDTDMGFAPDTLNRLVEAADATERPVVGALCFINSEIGSDGMGGVVTVPKPSVFFWGTTPDGPNGEKGGTGFLPMIRYPEDELIECSGTGAACVLVHRSVFEAMREKWGNNFYGNIANPDGGQAFSEDFSFCIRCAEFGIPVHVHTGIKTTHQKVIYLQESHHQLWSVGAA
jgi:hypothetical protein